MDATQEQGVAKAMPRGTRRYATVNGSWPEGKLPPLTGPEAITAVKLLFRFAMKRPLRRTTPFKLTSGNRWTSIYYGRINPERGWHDLVHAVSHFCHRRLYPGVKPHDDLGRHAFLEREMIDYVVKAGWLDGKLKPEPKAAADVRTIRYQRTLDGLARWQSKLKRATTALAKLRRQKAYYERLGINN